MGSLRLSERVDRKVGQSPAKRPCRVICASYKFAISSGNQFFHPDAESPIYDVKQNSPAALIKLLTKSQIASFKSVPVMKSSELSPLHHFLPTLGNRP